MKRVIIAVVVFAVLLIVLMNPLMLGAEAIRPNKMQASPKSSTTPRVTSDKLKVDSSGTDAPLCWYQGQQYSKGAVVCMVDKFFYTCSDFSNWTTNQAVCPK